jgi:putative flavoprotein involved in K+ transport
MATEEIDVVVIGAGQAGLAASHELGVRGVEHVVLERDDQVAGSWAHRWDSFCLVTPNHTITLPGGEYRGPEPSGYLSREGIVAHLQDYAASFGAPVRTGIGVEALTPAAGGLLLRTAEGDHIRARTVVVATGAFQKVNRPAWVSAVPADGPVLDSLQYLSPASLPDGAVLVVGSGQTGCQLAEELVLAGRRVILACGRAPWMYRRLDGIDFVDWLQETPFFDLPVSALPVPQARFTSNPQATGAGDGHDLTTRTLAALGVQLSGHVGGVADAVVTFVDDLAASVAWGDDRFRELRDLIQTAQTGRGKRAPSIPPPPAFDGSAALLSLDLSEVGSVVLTMGYRPDYSAWIDVPGAFDELGFPVHSDGASTVVPDLYFVGVHFLRTRRSALLMGVGRDASLVADSIAST